MAQLRDGGREVACVAVENVAAKSFVASDRWERAGSRSFAIRQGLFARSTKETIEFVAPVSVR
jgi:hypothetical protein